MKVIINADDCGYSESVNQHIEDAILKRRISSTTIIANMDDLDGAVRLYNKYKDRVSFGFHPNLTEGSPITESKNLIDAGFFYEEDGKLLVNAHPFRRKLLNSAMRESIYNEVLAQAKRILDRGINFSHIDGHHFIQQSTFMISLLPRLCKEIGVYKIRNYRNYMPMSANKLMRDCWGRLLKIQCSKIKYPDYFIAYKDFYELYSQGKCYATDGVLELMCHPGGIYTDEEDLLMANDPEELYGMKLITYNEL